MDSKTNNHDIDAILRKHNLDGAKGAGKKNDNGAVKGLAMLSQFGLTMATCIVSMLLLGRLLDKWLGTAPWLMVVFAFIGGGAAIKFMYDMAMGWK
jgi:ATP synthase protein I